jgi:hypothetical protein
MKNIRCNIWKICVSALVFTCLALLFAATTHANTYAVVTGSTVNVRSSAEIISTNRLFQVQRGSSVQLHGSSGEFFRATIGTRTDVYISKEWVRITQTEGSVLADYAMLYNLPPSHGGTGVSMVSFGDTLRVTGVYERWYRLCAPGGAAFIEVSQVQIPYFVDELPAARLDNALGYAIVERAMQFLGAPYRWGGTTPRGFDCSGFVMYVIRYFDIPINRTSREQVNNGVAVTRAELCMGDLVFFSSRADRRIDHVGIYVGNGRFIHSADYGIGVVVSVLDTQWAPFVTARRVT